MKVLHEDLRALGYCNRGAREWFSDRRLNWSQFIRNGLPEEALAAFDNELVRNVVGQSHRRDPRG